MASKACDECDLSRFCRFVGTYTGNDPYLCSDYSDIQYDLEEARAEEYELRHQYDDPEEDEEEEE